MNKKKHIKQIARVKAAISLLNNEINSLNNYHEIQTHLDLFAKFFKEQANEKNDRANKSLMGFINYFNKVAPKQRSIKAVKSKAKKLTAKSYKNYISEYQILRARGLSYQKIADYSAQHFKVKVSKESIRTALTELEECH
jgi:uncharacterized protein YaaW (UPF0174 family)